MGFTVKQECPQCGAPIELDETDHLLQCPYCDTRSFLFTPNYFRYALPHKTEGKEMIYAPYLRFKGNVFYCRGLNVGHRIVDITHVGLPLKGLPSSLGLRPQTLKMRFVTPDTGGSFLKFSLKATDILKSAARLPGNSSAPFYHRAYIGETLSLIYLPLYAEGDRLYDAVLDRPLTRLPEGRETLASAMEKKPTRGLCFISTLCPQCGWNLTGERDSVVLTCGNCDTAWQAVGGKLSRVKLLVATDPKRDTVYLPFWKTSTHVTGVEIRSFADFIRITNQPRVVGKEWEVEPMSFWCPAFKIRPKIFLNLSRQLTVSQRHFQTEETIPKQRLYPVTLPQDEAAQSMKITLAGSTLNKKNVLPRLPRVGFEVKDTHLVYLPFSDMGHEMVHPDMRISINKNALRYGRQL
ncbi:MAG: hypothetical protein V2J25_15960 [Desulfatiglans sp.]|jgi:hypothetical protein|nr:hypothetical protein [Thermodesulfobacteriota bacterium]MEE4354357.1 hypothetical protein [Desulfatiglans sp.]